MVFTDPAFADNICLTEDNPEDTQKLLNCFTNSAAKCGLQLKTSKTKFCSSFSSDHIECFGEPLERVNSFCYLGNNIQLVSDVSHEVSIRIGRAMSKLSSFWKQRSIPNTVKLKVYHDAAANLLYGCGTCPLKTSDIKRLDSTEGTRRCSSHQKL